jgi:hypothetical protein
MPAVAMEETAAGVYPARSAIMPHAISAVTAGYTELLTDQNADVGDAALKSWPGRGRPWRYFELDRVGNQLGYPGPGCQMACGLARLRTVTVVLRRVLASERQV